MTIWLKRQRIFTIASSLNAAMSIQHVNFGIPAGNITCLSCDLNGSELSGREKTKVSKSSTKSHGKHIEL